MTISIGELITEARDFINTSWKYHQLHQDKNKFDQLASSLDTIEDAENAILAFNTDDVGEETGTLYLITYGLLQAFFVQQDAVDHLCEALGIKNSYSNYPQLIEVREIRNDTVGHPTKRDRQREKGKSGITSYHQISQITMSKQGFQVISRYSDGTNQFRDISIPDLITDQNKFIVEMLTDMIEKLKAEFKAHKEKFRMEKLVPLFPHTLTYAFEKAYAALSNGPVEMGHWGLSQIKEVFHNFREAVGRRDGERYTNLEHDFTYIDHAIAQLEHIYELRSTNKIQRISELDGVIYLSYLEQQRDELMEYATQIDTDYEDVE